MRHVISSWLVAVSLAAIALTAGPGYASEAADALLFRPNVPDPPTGDTFTFVVMADVQPHVEEPVGMPEPFLDTIAEVNGRAPAFSIVCGDLIFGYNENMDLIGREWDEYLKAVKTLKQPLFSVLGNHDITNQPMEDYFLERFGDLRWHSFDYGPVHFILLDSEQPSERNKIVGTQLEWLKADLEASRDKKFKFVFVHKPLWRGGQYGSQWNDEIHPLLAKYRVTAAFAGHEHAYVKDPGRDGVAYYRLGPAGGLIWTPEYLGGFYHFMEVTVKQDSVKILLNRRGEIYPDDYVDTPHVQQLAKLQNESISSIETPAVEPTAPLEVPVRFALENPTTYEVEYEALLHVPPGARVEPVDPITGTLGPSESVHGVFTVTCESLDETRAFSGPVLDVRYTAACKHMNAKLPVRQRVPLRVIMPGRLPAASAVDRAVHLDGKSAVQVPYDEALNVKGPFTFEAWFRVESLGGRVGAMNRTESSSYGLFFAEADTPQLKLIIHDAQARRYAEAKNDTERPPVGHWFHVACTYNGVTMAVWLDGKKIVEADAPKEITPNTLPMYLGADVLGNGEPISFLNGEIDEFRLSNVCRYTAAFEPAKRFETDEHTLVLYHLDRAFVNTVVDSSGNGLHGIVVGNAVFDAHADVD